MPVRIQEFELLPGGTATGERGDGETQVPEAERESRTRATPQDIRDLIRRAAERVYRLSDY